MKNEVELSLQYVDVCLAANCSTIVVWCRRLTYDEAVDVLCKHRKQFENEITVSLVASLLWEFCATVIATSFFRW